MCSLFAKDSSLYVHCLYFEKELELDELFRNTFIVIDVMWSLIAKRFQEGSCHILQNTQQ